MGCAAVFAALAVACDSGRNGNTSDPSPTEVAALAVEHVRGLPPSESESDLAGRVIGAECKAFGGLKFNGETVFWCLVSHASGTVAEWCLAVEDDGEVVTDRADNRISCR